MSPQRVGRTEILWRPPVPELMHRSKSIAESGSDNDLDSCAVTILPISRSKIASHVQFQSEPGWS